jgi:predicted Zn-dependent peptidase
MVQKTTLENGIQVITEEIPHVHSVSVGIWVKSGSRDERRGENGISHFIEHMLFKGTKRRSAEQIAKEIDAVGGVLNAFTTKEFSSFYAKVLANHLPVALDLLFDLFLNSLFSREEIDKERQVIIQEISMVEDTPDEYIHDLFSQSFWPRHPLGFPILGRVETISLMGQKGLMEFYRQHYLGARPIIVAAGNLKHENLLRPVRETLGKIKPLAEKRQGRPPHPHPCLLVKHKKLEQAHLLLGTPGLSVAHPGRYAFFLLNTILGGGMSSRLFQEIREKRGLAYSVYSFLSSFIDNGMLGVYVGVGESTLAQALQLILREMRKLAAGSLKPKELRAAKEQLKGNLLLSLESTDSRMTRLAKNELYFNRFVGTEEIIEGIERVSVEEVCTLARENFRPDYLSLTVLGPVTEKAIPRGLFSG